MGELPRAELAGPDRRSVTHHARHQGRPGRRARAHRQGDREALKAKSRGSSRSSPTPASSTARRRRSSPGTGAARRSRIDAGEAAHPTRSPARLNRLRRRRRMRDSSAQPLAAFSMPNLAQALSRARAPQLSFVLFRPGPVADRNVAAAGGDVLAHLSAVGLGAASGVRHVLPVHRGTVHRAGRGRARRSGRSASARC